MQAFVSSTNSSSKPRRRWQAAATAAGTGSSAGTAGAAAAAAALPGCHMNGCIHCCCCQLKPGAAGIAGMKGIPVSADSWSLPAAAAMSSSAAKGLVVATGTAAGRGMPPPQKPAARKRGRIVCRSVAVQWQGHEHWLFWVTVSQPSWAADGSCNARLAQVPLLLLCTDCRPLAVADTSVTECLLHVTRHARCSGHVSCDVYRPLPSRLDA
jgi:hypothetical protein